MKYKVGDRVRIKSIDWYNKNKSKSHGTVVCGDKYFEYDMREWCGKTMTILKVYQTCYIMQEDGAKDLWTDEMFEGLVEEETVLNKWNGLKVELELSKSVIDVSNIESLHGERFMSGFVKAIIPPEGYIFKDENGNEILTSKIILEKKKKEYPKTYEECCKIMGINHTNDLDICEHCDYKTEITYYEDSLLEKIETLYRLRICRDAYWKIAGEEMELGKPWEPDYTEESWEQGCPIKYVIYYTGTNITKERKCTPSYILSFPTEEMRDAFYENFKKEIEICKELL